MHRLLCLFLLLPVMAAAQLALELEPSGFPPVTVTIPSTLNEKLVDLTRAWAQEYNRRNDRGYDFLDVTDNSITVSSYKKNAFFYRDRGQSFNLSINYTMQLTFSESSYTLAFTVTDIFADNDKLLEYHIPDYFTSEGKLKEGYDELDTSLEKNVNDIARSHYNFLINFR
jgi:hypothetical protein